MDGVGPISGILLYIPLAIALAVGTLLLVYAAKRKKYWPFILSRFTDVQFTNPQEISIIPDTHVLQSSVYLGVTPPGATSLQTELAWKKLLKDSGINPSQVHPVLWHWSRNKFQPEV